jgi:hypothetical protein
MAPDEALSLVGRQAVRHLQNPVVQLLWYTFFSHSLHRLGIVVMTDSARRWALRGRAQETHG